MQDACSRRVSPLLPNTFVLAFSRVRSCNGLPVNAICRLIALSFATALTGCGTEGFYVAPTVFPLGGFKPDTLIITSNTTLGYAFTVSSPIRVTDLGLYDINSDLQDQHAVAIWTSTGTQLLQLTISAGTGATLTDGFRYVSIAPFLLVPGTYTIGGFYAGDSDSSLDAASITGASGLSYLGSRSAFGFTFPSGDAIAVVNSYFGPNFQFITGVGVPTHDSGSTVSLLGFALLGLAAVRRGLRCQERFVRR